MSKILTRAARDAMSKMKTNRWGLFDGAKINRALPKPARVDPSRFTQQALDRGALVLPITRGNRVLLETDRLSGRPRIKWMTKPEIEDLFGLQYRTESTSFATRQHEEGAARTEEENDEEISLMYLGESDSSNFFAIVLPPSMADEVGTNQGPGPNFGELRTFMKNDTSLLGSEQASSLSKAGYALALGNWARGVSFCPACGSSTRPTQIGTRMECTSPSCGKKQYPRLDPVVIMLVVSEDGRNALLASPRYASGRMLTCLAGFIEQCETIEEAVAREVFEECGVAVSEVSVVGSQPWPLGRSGACELMIGCVAKARSSELFVDKEELNSAQWLSREIVAEKLAKSKARYSSKKSSSSSPTSSSTTGEMKVEKKKETWIVPPYAIAHHLIDYWINGPAGSNIDQAAQPMNLVEERAIATPKL